MLISINTNLMKKNCNSIFLFKTNYNYYTLYTWEKIDTSNVALTPKGPWPFFSQKPLITANSVVFTSENKKYFF